jgi:hypothetical protein
VKGAGAGLCGDPRRQPYGLSARSGPCVQWNNRAAVIPIPCAPAPRAGAPLRHGPFGPGLHSLNSRDFCVIGGAKIHKYIKPLAPAPLGEGDGKFHFGDGRAQPGRDKA